MNTSRHHADWLSLVEVSGPFVSLPVLLRVFPQGLDARDPAQAKALRAAYDEWQKNPTAPGRQRAWILHVLTDLLRYPGELITEGQTLPAGLEDNVAQMGETLRPDFALVGPKNTETAGQAHLLISTYRSWLDDTGAPVGVQQKLMRHAQVSTTMNIYGNALMGAKREANSKVVKMALRSA